MSNEFLDRHENKIYLEFARKVADDLTPYRCIGPQYEHVVTDDNPRRTGRCLVCRKFVVKVHDRGWRTATMQQAGFWGLLADRAPLGASLAKTPPVGRSREARRK